MMMRIERMMRYKGFEMPTAVKSSIGASKHVAMKPRRLASER